LNLHEIRRSEFALSEAKIIVTELNIRSQIKIKMAVRNIKLAVKRDGVLLGILPELWLDQKSDADIQGGKHDHIPNAITPALTVPTLLCSSASAWARVGTTMSQST
jgi:hypothetical protein